MGAYMVARCYTNVFNNYMNSNNLSSVLIVSVTKISHEIKVINEYAGIDIYYIILYRVYDKVRLCHSCHDIILRAIVVLDNNFL